MAFHDVRMRGFKSRANVADVLAWIDARVAPLDAEVVSLDSAAGRVLAEAVVSDVDVPAFRRSAMDGWSLRGAETFGATELEPLQLRIVGDSRPGASPPDAGVGEAIRIRTGAPLSAGADAVLPAEFGIESADRLEVRGEVPPGRHVGSVGEDVRRGETVLPAGRVIRPQDLGLLSSIGRGTVAVVRRPTVAILVTGDEVLPAGSAPSGTRTPDANGPMLDALVRRDGGVPGARSIFSDEDPRLEREIAESPADVVLVTGASSVGPEDRVPSLVAALGDLAFHGIAMRPSSPTGVGVVAGRVVFLLPGNPVSCLCAYDFFAGRLLRRLGGGSVEWPYRTATLPLARKVVSELGRVDYLRVAIRDGTAVPLTARGAGVLTTATRGDGFVVVPQHIEGWAEGESVVVHRYDA